MAKRTGLEQRKRRLALPLLAPAGLLYGVLYLYPAIRSFNFALTDWNGVTSAAGVGVDNFERLAGDDRFRSVVLNTFEFTLIGALVLFPAAMFFAYVLNGRHGRGTRLVRFTIIAPITLSVTAAALMWKFGLNPTFGLVRGFGDAIGAETLAVTPWLGRPSTALLAVVLATIWQGIGVWVIFMTAALQRVPDEIVDAARTDGASGFQVFSRVVLPSAWPVIRLLIIIWVIQGIQTFPFVIAMTNGGPLGSTEVMGTYLYRAAFESGTFGYASAIAVVLFVVVLTASAVTDRATRIRRWSVD